MMTPHFLPLAQLDDRHFINACRHGIVHLTWGRTTTRFSRDEFRRLAALLEQAAAAPPPSSARDGNLRVTTRLDEVCELRVESLVLLLSPGRFREFVKAARDAVDRLEELLTSGVWSTGAPERAPTSFLEQLRRSSFSVN